ncbi:hypothetical protein [Paenibacillus macquariensis]|nr:hypothetical protein [Paenibacillus macquariensis]MEC0090382.1 hypothetical protein [Paenibacillus macquariensis]
MSYSLSWGGKYVKSAHFRARRGKSEESLDESRIKEHMMLFISNGDLA